jgi:hypothetical protein
VFAAAVRLAPHLTDAPASNRRAWGQRSREPDPTASNSAAA